MVNKEFKQVEKISYLYFSLPHGFAATCGLLKNVVVAYRNCSANFEFQSVIAKLLLRNMNLLTTHLSLELKGYF